MKTSAGIIPFAQEPGKEPRYLIMRCYNNWDFPKGEHDEHETPILAALRYATDNRALVAADFLRLVEGIVESGVAPL